jgi:hypothetical protein
MNKYSYLTKTALLVAAILILGGIAVGCGGDDDDSSSTGGTTKSGTGGASSSNTTGTGGSSATTSSTAGSNATAANACTTTTTTCGGQSCDVSTANTALAAKYKQLSSLQSSVCYNACCTADNVCGAKLKFGGLAGTFIPMIGGTAEGGCVALNQEGTANTACPAATEGAAGEDAGAGRTTNVMAQGIQNMMGDVFNYSGCCRPDSKCGLNLTDIGLGCVANEDIGQLNAFFATMSPKGKTCTK